MTFRTADDREKIFQFILLLLFCDTTLTFCAWHVGMNSGRQTDILLLAHRDTQWLTVDNATAKQPKHQGLRVV
ncbi:hypothetical protein Bpfe_029514 [Biomphalaria pfeifferi]|uniref:Uncharacterized protein n=1 Tax=Biomphalaria pfeifferi TaxID=112525 RepID=A0AAD8EUN8_BIOPF|nr:hypothetical protein Bpfe_029514 [Biomphalaria pfeifferi]